MSKPRSTSPQVTTEELDQRTLLLIRRVLCSHSPPTTPLEELLPALTSSTEIDVQLYAVIAIVVRDFILSWYSHISNDHAFIDEIIALIAHCTRALEERLRKVDLELLLLDEIPAILDAHVKDYRRAVERHETALAPHLSLSEIFRNYQPHPALTNSPESERLYLKLVSNGILAVLLPTEDLESNCERSLLREILGSMVFGNVLDKLSEPFTIYEIITTIVRQLRPDLAPIEPPPVTTRRGSVKPGGVRLTSPSPDSPPPPSPPAPPSNIERTLTIVGKTVGVLFSILSSLHQLLLSPLPQRPVKKRPLIRSALFSAVATVFNLRALQPWLPATLRLLAHPFSTRATKVGAIVDDLLISKLQPLLSSSKVVVDILKSARAALFPGNAMGPPRKYPSEKEKKRIRKVAEATLLDAVPKVVTNVWWKGLDRQEKAREVGRNWLDAFGDKDVNKVLVIRLLDLLVGRLLPELLESGGAEIRVQRTGMDLLPVVAEKEEVVYATV
ncbi:PXA domain-containing protein [Sphaerosporella brunnea]|uniref:PXA domain-containing protein n=1 Tax=Sphaerosporella brunnea TaxID=1250544 RepID=A0A5J5F7M0_9PEZI|nr:PXA domain-containing protein [Sphaerosporella brunnea]